MAADCDHPRWRAVVDGTLGVLQAQPFTQAELDRGIRQLLTGCDQAYASPASLAAVLSQASAQGDWRLFFLARDRVRHATLDQVQKATEAYLVRSNRTTGRYIPTAKPVRDPAPKAADLNAVPEN